MCLPAHRWSPLLAPSIDLIARMEAGDHVFAVADPPTIGSLLLPAFIRRGVEAGGEVILCYSSHWLADLKAALAAPLPEVRTWEQGRLLRYWRMDGFTELFKYPTLEGLAMFADRIRGELQAVGQRGRSSIWFANGIGSLLAGETGAVEAIFAEVATHALCRGPPIGVLCTYLGPLRPEMMEALRAVHHRELTSP